MFNFFAVVPTSFLHRSVGHLDDFHVRNQPVSKNEPIFVTKFKLEANRTGL